MSMGQMMNNTGLSAIQAHEAESSQDSFLSEELSQLQLIPKPVLQGQQQRRSASERREEMRELIVRRGF